VLVLEREEVGHPRSGSKGNARIFRFGYDDPFYVALARSAKPRWRDLEADSGRSLLTETGQLSFGPGLEALRESMSAGGARFEDMTPGEASSRFPGIRLEGPAILEPESGVLAADSCLAALRHCALDAGAVLTEHCVVESIAQADPLVSIETSDGGVDASVALVCAGHWTAPLAKSAGIALRLRATLEQAVFLAPSVGNETRVPVFIEYRDPWVYGLPTASGLLKVSLHGAGPAADPDITPLDPDPHLLATIAAHSRRLIPSHHPEPVSTERCFYDTTADGDFVLDRKGRIVVGAGTSGHGFKFGPLLGEALADLATGSEPAFDLSRFSADRAAVGA
jgi:sarcosine oxidase